MTDRSEASDMSGNENDSPVDKTDWRTMFVSMQSSMDKMRDEITVLRANNNVLLQENRELKAKIFEMVAQQREDFLKIMGSRPQSDQSGNSTGHQDPRPQDTQGQPEQIQEPASLEATSMDTQQVPEEEWTKVQSRKKRRAPTSSSSSEDDEPAQKPAKKAANKRRDPTPEGPEPGSSRDQTTETPASSKRPPPIFIHKEDHRATNPRGRILEDILDRITGTTILGPEEPTILPPRGLPDVIDIAILRGGQYVAETWTIMEGSSDHNPIILDLELADNDPISNEPRMVRRVNFDLVRNLIHGNLGPLPEVKTPSDIERAARYLEECINAALNEATTLENINAPNRFRDIPENISRIITERNRIRRQAQTTLSPADRADLRRKNNEVREALQTHHLRQWESRLEELDPGDCSMWRLQRILRRRRKPPTAIHGERCLVYANNEKAEAFADSIELQCRDNNHPDQDEDWIDLNERLTHAKRQILGGMDTNSDRKSLYTKENLKTSADEVQNQETYNPHTGTSGCINKPLLH
nr:unnamed protein product [Callosobruchus analis]